MARDAEKIVQHYSDRWIIEEFHGMLKKDCRDIEELAYRTAGRLQNMIAVYMVVAWWLMLILHLARTKPDLPPETVFDEDGEIRLLSKSSFETVGYLDR